MEDSDLEYFYEEQCEIVSMLNELGHRLTTNQHTDSDVLDFIQDTLPEYIESLKLELFRNSISRLEA